MRSRHLSALALVAACGGTPTTSTANIDDGYVLASRAALDARLRFDDGTPLGVMPVALDDRPYMLAVGDRTLAVETGEGVLTYASTADAHDIMIIGGDVYADRLAIDGDQASIARIASELDATVEASGDGRWILHGEDLWPRTAALEPSGITEVTPIMITSDGRMAIAGSPPIDRDAARPAPASTVSERAPVAVAETAAAKGACADPHAGVWVARTHRTEADDWHEFTLHITPTSRGIVTTLDVTFWAGDADDPSIGTCDDGSLATGAGSMTATAAWHGDQLSVDATRLRSIRGVCGVDDVGYALDHFTGALRGTDAIAMKNTDYQAARGRPYLFKRVSCTP